MNHKKKDKEERQDTKLTLCAGNPITLVQNVTPLKRSTQLPLEISWLNDTAPCPSAFAVEPSKGKKEIRRENTQ